MSFHLMRLILEVSLSLHFYIRLRVAFGVGNWQPLVIIWLLLMLAPLFFQEWISKAPPELHNFMAQAWPLWVGFLILFTVVCLGLDLARLGVGLAGLAADKPWWGLLAAKRAVPAALILTLAVSGYAYYSAYHPRLVRVEFSTTKLPAGVDRLRIVQLTDVHLSRLITLKNLEVMAELVREAKPDLLVVTGDLVDADMRGRSAEAALLASLKPSYGAYGVFGNHELYTGEDSARDFYHRAGIRLLRGEAAETGGLIVAGMDDEVFGGRRDLTPPPKLLRRFDRDSRFVLFLKHRPTMAPGTAGLFDLQLSGHTHGGQIWPGHLIIKKVNGVLHGLHYDGQSRSAVYTSRGAGFWGLPMRFLAPPEVTLIELTRP